MILIGQIAKSITEHKANGTYRADRHGNLELPVSVPPPAKDLTPRALEIYHQIAARLQELGVISDLDALALSEVAAISDELEQCRQHISKDGIMTKEGRPHPLTTTSNQLRGTQYKYLTQLGLTPRSRTGIETKPIEHDPLADFDAA